ncbi:uncharacterized protein BDZ99DRAFT_104778 [Mytilinidion resinicola]|uniref:Uncharacterized protein n=1 Tax=Mytilinidion resinicola TaxID=574789 RepID=A0A6A6YBC1_9PEZI|nr:uncharacterized protein BDZ99DRAFT_104778 [Mytilinidion resinicola]KAF2805405.1 hypothetical protein BDZ99DRAFT_104778 [Mytilinidion resinicola]
MRLSSFASLLLASTSLVTARVLPRDDDNRDEVVYLLNCKNYFGNSVFNSGSKDALWLLPNFETSRNAGQHPIEAYPSDHGLGKDYGDMDYTVGTEAQPITGTLDGRLFQVWGLAEKGDPNTSLTGEAKLGGHDMACYQAPTVFTQTISKDRHYKCVARYWCTRRDRTIRRTSFGISNTTADVILTSGSPGDATSAVILANVKEALRNLQVAYDGDLSDDAAVFTIKDTESAISFAIDFDEKAGDLNFDPNRLKDMADQLVDKLAPAIANAAKLVKCSQGWGAQYASCTYKLVFPEQIKIESQITLQANQNWITQDKVKIIVGKKAGGKDECKTDGAVASVFAGVFGALGAITTGGMSGVAQGLGGVFGAIHAAKCGLPI